MNYFLLEIHLNSIAVVMATLSMNMEMIKWGRCDWVFLVDLFMFFAKVQRAGGYEAAVSNKLWKAIYIELGGHPSNTSAATCTRRHYEK